MTRTLPDHRIDVPDGEEPAARCPYCDRPFRTDHLYALHLGEAHPDDCTDDERAVYEDAYDEESHELFTFHVKVVVALILTYFVFTYIYGIVWT